MEPPFVTLEQNVPQSDCWPSVSIFADRCTDKNHPYKHQHIKELSEEYTNPFPPFTLTRWNILEVVFVNVQISHTV